jgi:LysR family transcriptional regulator, carnitine catabolism transcriptional activator
MAMTRGIGVVIRDMNMRGVVASVLAGEVDLGIGSALNNAAELDSVVLARDSFHALVPITSPLARRRTLKWRDLADQPFIAMSHDTGLRDLVDAAVGEQGIQLKIVAEVSNIATLNGMLEEGLGVSALPGLVLPRNDQPFLRHRPLTEPKVQRTIRLFWRGAVGLSPAAQALVMALCRALESDRNLSELPHVEWQAGAVEALTRVVERQQA